MLYDYDGSGVERDIVASVHTLMIYEQQFKTGMIEDVFGRVSLEGHENDIDEDGNLRVADYTIDHWGAYVRALWAMLKAGSDLARAEGRPYDIVPSFDAWSVTAVNVDLSELSRIVIGECQRGLFRAGAAAAAEGGGQREEA